jgi:hypothetical protein
MLVFRIANAVMAYAQRKKEPNAIQKIEAELKGMGFRTKKP